MQNQIVVHAIASRQSEAFNRLMTLFTNFKCNILQSRVLPFGQEMSQMFLLTGTWDAIAKLEAALPKLEQTSQIKTICQRTNQAEFANGYITYMVHGFSLDKIGLLQAFIQFFVEQTIEVLEVNTQTDNLDQAHPTAHFSLKVSIPVSKQLACLREQFFALCDSYNADASLEPLVK